MNSRLRKLQADTDAALLAEWVDLSRGQQDALAAARESSGGWTLYGDGTNGGVLAGLRIRLLVDGGTTLWPRGEMVRTVGMAKRSGR